MNVRVFFFFEKGKNLRFYGISKYACLQKIKVNFTMRWCINLTFSYRFSHFLSKKKKRERKKMYI